MMIKNPFFKKIDGSLRRASGSSASSRSVIKNACGCIYVCMGGGGKNHPLFLKQTTFETGLARTQSSFNSIL